MVALLPVVVASVLTVGFVVFIYLSRSGNFPLIPVSDLEFEWRSRLADLFSVRPRTKEFLLGYPALLLGSWLGPPALRRGWGFVLAALGGVAASSVLNTFVHLHIPAAVSTGRTLVGLGLGLAVGLLAVLLFEGLRRLRAPAVSGSKVVTCVSLLLTLAGLAFTAANLPAAVLPHVGAAPVELALDLGDLWRQVGGDGHAAGAALEELRRAGLTSVALGETTLGALTAGGGPGRPWSVTLVAGRDLQARVWLGEAGPLERAVARTAGFDGAGSILFLPAGSPTRDILERLAASAGDRFRELVRVGSTVVVTTPYPPHLAREVGLGFLPSEAGARLAPAAGSGLLVVPRPRNPHGGDPEVLAARLDELREVLDTLKLDWSTVVFEGPEVGGYPDAVGGVLTVLRERGLVPGFILDPHRPGYVGQAGTVEAARRAGYRFAAVLPVVAGEGPARETADRAAARGASLVYLRLPERGPVPVGFIGGLSSALTEKGAPPGRAATGRPLLVVPGGAAEGPWLEAGLTLALVGLPWAGAALLQRALRERRLSCRGAASRPAGAACLASAALWPLGLSLLGGLAARAFLGDAEVLLGLRPVDLRPVLPSLPLVSAGAALVALEPWGSGPAPGPSRWWRAAVTPVLGLVLAVAAATGWAVTAVWGGAGAAVAGTVVLGLSLAAVGLPGETSVRRAVGGAAAEVAVGVAGAAAAFGGSGLALYVARLTGTAAPAALGAAAALMVAGLSGVRRPTRCSSEPSA